MCALFVIYLYFLPFIYLYLISPANGIIYPNAIGNLSRVYMLKEKKA